MGQRPDKSLASLADCYKPDVGVIKLPDPDRYLQYTYQDDAPERELNFVERPLASLYRTLMASRGRLRQVQTTEIALARVKELLPLWAQTALKGMNNMKKRQDYRDDHFLRAIADLQPALASMATPGCTQPSEESLLGLFQSRETLGLLLPCIEGDKEAQSDLWEAYLEGKKTSLSDWTRPSLREDQRLVQHLDMIGESYIRDVPQG